MSETETTKKGGNGKPDETPELIETQPSAVPVVFSRDPKQALAQMRDLVKDVAKECTGPNFISNIKGKQYPKVEWWTTVGASLGLFPVNEWAKRLDRDGEIVYEARVSVRNQGNVVTAAQSLCSSKEDNWHTENKKTGDITPKDEHAIMSMAITRATSKSFRIGLSMLAVMAGLEPTPAEEIPPNGFSDDFNKKKGPPKESKKARKISKKQMERIEQLAIHRWGEDVWEVELNKAIEPKMKVKSYKDLTYNQAMTVGKRLKQLIDEREGKTTASLDKVEDLIKTAEYTWKMKGKSNILAILNDRAKKRWGKTVDKLESELITQMKKDVLDLKLRPTA